ncbi:MAG: hypothetical protein IT538_14145, partial [Variibacter sp.]|nr:hypothetical protein [Variibacter sp.]
VVAHAAALRKAGIDAIIIRPFAPEGGSIEDTIRTFGREVWPQVEAAARA